MDELYGIVLVSNRFRVEGALVVVSVMSYECGECPSEKYFVVSFCNFSSCTCDTNIEWQLKGWKERRRRGVI